MGILLKSTQLISMGSLFNASDEIENFNFYKNLKQAISEDILIFGRMPKLLFLLDLVTKTKPYEILETLKSYKAILKAV